MTSFKTLLTGCAAALLCGVVYATATAQKLYDNKTSFVFHREVELPGGRTLQPGKYVFRVVDSSAGRHIVQVLDEDETQVHATMLAVEPRDDAVILGDTPINAPAPIRYWYHSGRSVRPLGYEFVYSKDQAPRIASLTRQRVLITDVDVHDAGAMMRARLRTVDPNGAMAAYPEHTRPEVHSTYAEATSREVDAPGSEGSAAAPTELSPLLAVPSGILIAGTLLGAGLVALGVHSRTRRRPLERTLAESECAPASRTR